MAKGFTSRRGERITVPGGTVVALDKCPDCGGALQWVSTRKTGDQISAVCTNTMKAPGQWGEKCGRRAFPSIHASQKVLRAFLENDSKPLDLTGELELEPAPKGNPDDEDKHETNRPKQRGREPEPELDREPEPELDREPDDDDEGGGGIFGAFGF